MILKSILFALFLLLGFAAFAFFMFCIFFGESALPYLILPG